ncbi:MAG TPA: DUF3098 domain-containing protein [Saprospiraceae bacterium]|nr:DUF3098 domain-containing protein [Saprospiraceae bacterium]
MAKNQKRTSSRKQKAPKVKNELIFGRVNYLWMLGGAILIVIGLALMTGGKMPSPEVWDDQLIYSFRRTVLAPIVILAGFVVEIFAVFKKPAI